MTNNMPDRKITIDLVFETVIDEEAGASYERLKGVRMGDSEIDIADLELYEVGVQYKKDILGNQIQEGFFKSAVHGYHEIPEEDRL